MELNARDAVIRVIKKVTVETPARETAVYAGDGASPSRHHSNEQGLIPDKRRIRTVAEATVPRFVCHNINQFSQSDPRIVEALLSNSFGYRSTCRGQAATWLDRIACHGLDFT